MEQTDLEIMNKIRGVMAEALGVDVAEVTSTLEFGELVQWDSMGHMEVMVSLEEHFGIDINADTISALISIPIIFEHIEGKNNG